MNIHYTVEKNTQILIQLLKMHHIKKVIVSPGSTNICFAASIQQDAYFDVYSSVDERSAAYMACGLAAESKEPVAISCTGATASRNYMPGLTEAYYRHIPVLAITSTQSIERVAHNIPQVTDRSVIPNDVVNLSVHIPTVVDKETEWSCEAKINKALLALRHRGGGPVHINLTTAYTPDFSAIELPLVRTIERVTLEDSFPEIIQSRVAVFVGAHARWEPHVVKLVDKFCEKYNAVVLCDHTSNYWGKYRILPNVLCAQQAQKASCTEIDLLIHIGEISGAYMSIFPKEVWRVHEDGEVRDPFKKLRYVFEMTEEKFFATACQCKSTKASRQQRETYFEEWQQECASLVEKMPELPFSNVWIAQQTAGQLPSDVSIHFGILNSFRSWNYFEVTKNTLGFCNTGGFGIDGGVSSLLGASLANRNKLFFGVVGDLAFFYDMNALGNRHLKNNIRLLVINNGKGNEFRNYGNWGAPLGDYADKFIAAAGHFGNKSSDLLKHFAQDLGFEYYLARNKEEYLEVLPHFIDPHFSEKPILVEIFTDTEEESDAIKEISNVEKSVSKSAKNVVKGILGERGTKVLKGIVKKSE